jgi:hypothetical protein
MTTASDQEMSIYNCTAGGDSTTTNTVIDGAESNTPIEGIELPFTDEVQKQISAWHTYHSGDITQPERDVWNLQFMQKIKDRGLLINVFKVNHTELCIGYCPC